VPAAVVGYVKPFVLPKITIVKTNKTSAARFATWTAAEKVILLVSKDSKKQPNSSFPHSDSI